MLDCEGILGLIEIFEDDFFIYLVLEYQESGSLLDYLKENGKSNEDQAKTIII